jgi:hypothetical protein
MFCNGFQAFSRCFFVSVSEACFECFICLQMYVASVASRCFKSKSGVAAPLSLLCCLALVPSPPLGAGWASSVPLLFPMLVTFRAARKTYAESGGGVSEKRDEARVSGWGGAEGAWAPTCARTHVNGAAGTDVRTWMSIHSVQTYGR